MILITIATIISIPVSYYLFMLYKIKNQEKATENIDVEAEAIELAENRLKEAKEAKERDVERSKRVLADKKEKLEQRKNFLNDKENILNERESILRKQVQDVELKDKEIKESLKSAETKYENLTDKLYEITNADKESLKSSIKEQLEKEISNYKANQIESKTSFLTNTIEERATEILEAVSQLDTSEYLGDSSNAHVSIKNESDVERVYGKNNENKDKLYELTEVELSENLEWMSIDVNCLDPIRREVGIRVVEDLLKMKKSNPTDVEGLVIKHKRILLEDVKKAGNLAAQQAGFPELPDKIKIMLGKGKYRFSYGQNLLQHHLEVALLAENLAPLLGADSRKSKLAAFIHDIGKVEAHDDGVPHHHISADTYAEFFPGDDVVYNAIKAHHYDIEAEYIESHIVRIVDAMSGARPGARRQSAEEYFEKIRQLEEIAKKPVGIQQAYAIRAGREVRIFVDPKRIDDENAQSIADSVAKEIEESMGYPGTIKVNVIRETVSTVVANKDK